MYAFVTATSTAAGQAAPGTTGPTLIALALGAFVLFLLAGAGFVGATFRAVAALAEVLGGLGKAVVTGFGKVIALVGVAVLIAYLVALMQNHQV